MNESMRLAEQISKALNGEAWHGPSCREALEGVGRETALQRPIPEAHSIAQIVLHGTTWHDVVRRRLEGESPEVTDSEDWPQTAMTDGAAWEAARARFFATGNALVKTVAQFPAEKLYEGRPGVEGTWYELIIGELQHVLYHLGQISLLKKAAVHAGVTR